MTSPACKVLIVEDERIVARDRQQTLIELGYDTLGIASSAAEALDLAAVDCPDLVLMDIRIKGSVDGITTAAMLHEQFDVPVIYLTAYADEATTQRATRTEPYAYLIKPVKSEQLRCAVEIALARHDLDRRLRDSAFRDPLTGLRSRTLLRGHVSQAISDSSRAGKVAALLFIDLDHFDDTNRVFGHKLGDRLLQAAANRRKQWLHADESLFRVGGDEFVLCVPGLDDAAQAYELADHIAADFRQPFDLGDNQTQITCTVGVAIHPQDGTDADTLVCSADAAAHRAKSNRRN
jgi:diguanylate cyclase (GGDEF)-like protein